jgi:hypothetical protein
MAHLLLLLCGAAAAHAWVGTTVAPAGFPDRTPATVLKPSHATSGVLVLLLRSRCQSAITVDPIAHFANLVDTVRRAPAGCVLLQHLAEPVDSCLAQLNYTLVIPEASPAPLASCSVCPTSLLGRSSCSVWGTNATTTANDIAYLSSVVTIAATQSVDPARVYVAGLDDGASMAYTVACSRPGLFAALLAINGESPNASSCGSKTVSVLVVAGKDPSFGASAPVAAAAAKAFDLISS